MIRDLLAVGVDLVQDWREQRKLKKTQEAFDKLLTSLSVVRDNRQGILDRLSQEDLSVQSRKAYLKLLHKLDVCISQMDLLVARGSSYGLQLRPDSQRQDRS